jgi:electron transport complex protein RnfD
MARGSFTFESPFLAAPDGAPTVFRVTAAAAAVPLLAGLFLFGFRAAYVTALAVATCVIVERLYYRVTRTPSLLGRSHAYLTGLLLALTLPPTSPWYVPVVAGAFAILVGKAVFGGVGHFLWQPALVGRLAAAVLFASVADPSTGPVLAYDKLLVGDVAKAADLGPSPAWYRHNAPQGYDAYAMTPVAATLAGLTRTDQPQFSGLANLPEPNMVKQARPTVLNHLPPMLDMLAGARAGGVGETAVLAIVLAGLYLIYRNYVKWQLPAAILVSAACVAAIAPIRLAGPDDSTVTVWWPVCAEGLDVGLIYVVYQLVSGGLFLAAFFLATEMTSRPVTAGGQAIFGLGCGALAMLLSLYVERIPIPAYIAMLALNTFTPTIDALWRPRVLGRSRFWRIRALFGKKETYDPEAG